MNPAKQLGLMVSMVCLLPHRSVADSTTQPTELPNFVGSVDPYGSYAFRTGLSGTDARLAVVRAGFTDEFRLPTSDSFAIDLQTLAEYSSYQFDQATAFLGTANRTLDLATYQITPGIEFTPVKFWTYYLGPFVQAAGPTGDSIDRSLTWGGYTGLGHVFSSRFDITIFCIGETELEHAQLVYPMVNLNWMLTDALKLTTRTTDFGGEFRLTQTFCQHYSAALQADYQARNFRLGDAPDLPTSRGLLHDSRGIVGLTLAWNPNLLFQASATAGYVVYGKIRFDDSAGDEIISKRVDPAPVISFQMSLRF